MRLSSFLFATLLFLASFSTYAVDLQYTISPDPLSFSFNGNMFFARNNFTNVSSLPERKTVTLNFTGSDATKSAKFIEVIFYKQFSPYEPFVLNTEISNVVGGNIINQVDSSNSNRETRVTTIGVSPNVTTLSFTITAKISPVISLLNDPNNTSKKYTSTATIGFVALKTDPYGFYEQSSEIQGKSIVYVEYSTCTVDTKDVFVNLRTAKLQELERANEILAGDFVLRLNTCGSRLKSLGENEIHFSSNTIESIYITFSDASDVSNTSEVLSLAPDASAQGVGLKLYPENNPTQAIRFGPESQQAPSQGNPYATQFGGYVKPENDFGHASQRYLVKYVKVGKLQPGTVKGLATFTFSYQ